MSHGKWFSALGTCALLASVSNTNASAQQIKTVFVIAMENHNWTQPANQFTGTIQQIFQNPSAPFINSLVDGSAYAIINGSLVHISEQVAYATNYHNVLATPGGNNPHIHPSEPNYIWAEAGTNFGVLNDNDPFDRQGPDQPEHRPAFDRSAHGSWKDVAVVSGRHRPHEKRRRGAHQRPAPQESWTVPLKSFNGNFAAGFVNDFNLATQFNYAAKHNPMVFFTDTNGGNDTTSANPLSSNTRRFSSCSQTSPTTTSPNTTGLRPTSSTTCTPRLAGGYKGLTGDPAKIKQGDDFLAQIIPVIMASNAYKNHGAIIIWFDESEQDAVGDNPDDFNHTIGEIVISPRAHENVEGLPYASTVNYTHSSDLRTMQEIFRVGPLLGDAANANDLSDLFKPGAIPKKP